LPPKYKIGAKRSSFKKPSNQRNCNMSLQEELERTDSSATEEEEYSDSEDEGILKGLSEEQRVGIYLSESMYLYCWEWQINVSIEAFSRTIKCCSKTVCCL
jgi:hypothetical protein